MHCNSQLKKKEFSTTVFYTYTHSLTGITKVKTKNDIKANWSYTVNKESAMWNEYSPNSWF